MSYLLKPCDQAMQLQSHFSVHAYFGAEQPHVVHEQLVMHWTVQPMTLHIRPAATPRTSQAVLRRVRGVQDISVELTDIQEAAKVAAMAGSRWTTIFKRQYRAELTMARTGLFQAAPTHHPQILLPWRTASAEDSMRYGFGPDFF